MMKQHEGTDKLRANMQAQLSRLLTQLKDVEDLKDDLEEEEYAHTKAETLQQLKDFEQSLGRIGTGSITLMDEISRMKLALRAAVAEAFRTPEVIKLFSLKQPGQLRERFAIIQTELKLGHLKEKQVKQEIVEILTALQKLGEPLNADEKVLLHSGSTDLMAALEAITVDEGMIKNRLLSMTNSNE
eukprot:c47173_g1_i1 orf=166-723(+)